MLLFNKSLSKLAISLILRRFFQQSRRIFPDLPMKKVEKKKTVERSIHLFYLAVLGYLSIRVCHVHLYR